MYVGVNVTRTIVAGNGIQSQISSKYMAMLGLAAHRALQKGGAPEEALVGESVSDY
jgi:hypothetical protein